MGNLANLAAVQRHLVRPIGFVPLSGTFFLGVRECAGSQFLHIEIVRLADIAYLKKVVGRSAKFRSAIRGGHQGLFVAWSGVPEAGGGGR
ncbi:TPA: hypothetical protein L4R02_001352 [Pseudomonas aeruginosa]|nr:hypothetical protein [Pseudomonas aeruginosa]